MRVSWSDVDIFDFVIERSLSYTQTQKDKASFQSFYNFLLELSSSQLGLIVSELSFFIWLYCSQNTQPSPGCISSARQERGQGLAIYFTFYRLINQINGQVAWIPRAWCTTTTTTTTTNGAQCKYGQYFGISTQCSSNTINPFVAVLLDLIWIFQQVDYINHNVGGNIFISDGVPNIKYFGGHTWPPRHEVSRYVTWKLDFAGRGRVTETLERNVNLDIRSPHCRLHWCLPRKVKV